MKLNHIISIILSSIISVTLLTGCEKSESIPEETTSSETTVSETTAKYSDEELELMIQDMPEVVFVLAYHNDNENIFGYFITKTGQTKMFDFRQIAPNETYMVSDVYNKLETALCSEIKMTEFPQYAEDIITEKNLHTFSAEELSSYYKKLLLIENNADYVEWGFSLDGTRNQFCFYGIKNNSIQEECILLDGIGDYYEYKHNNPEARTLCTDIKLKLPDLRYAN